jgi:hypothetical protein
MLYATLICTDSACAEELEAWGELDDFEALLCEGCGCVLQVIAVSEVSSATTLTELPAREPHLRLRDAA